MLYDAKRHTHTAQGLAVSTIWGDLLWVDGGWPGSCHEQELIELAGLDQALDDVEVASLLDRGFRGLAKAREHWHAPVGDRRTIDRLTDSQRAYNREQAGLRALVEQAIAHLANAWALRRWRGLLYRVRDVFRAAGALLPPAAAAGGPGAAAQPHERKPRAGAAAAPAPPPGPARPPNQTPSKISTSGRCRQSRPVAQLRLVRSPWQTTAMTRSSAAPSLPPSRARQPASSALTSA